MVAQYRWAPLANHIDVLSDSDHAGCFRTRKSTVGGVVLWGGRYLKGWSKTLDVLALSSGESELGGLIRATTEALGLKSLLKAFGRDTSINLLTDATAAIGMVRRLGLSRVRHLATADLWLQQKVRAGQI